MVAVRGSTDGGDVTDYRGLARRSPWVAAVLVVALTGLAGLPPGLAGLFAKVAVVRALLGGDAAWLAVVVALNAVIGLAYYVRVVAILFAAPAAAPLPPDSAVSASAGAQVRVGWPVGVAVGVAAVLTVLLGVAPQGVLELAAFFR
ncbi:hypothetical protein GCM10027610_112440 [Dactylosporangium cerinum]